MTRYQGQQAISALLQSTFSTLNGRALIEPYDLGTGKTFDPRDQNNFKTFVVIGRDESRRVSDQAFGDFGRTTVESNSFLRIFIATAQAPAIKLFTPEYYDMAAECEAWEQDLREFIVTNSLTNFNETIKVIGGNGRAFANYLHPSQRLYWNKWWWGITAYIDATQEV